MQSEQATQAGATHVEVRVVVRVVVRAVGRHAERERLVRRKEHDVRAVVVAQIVHLAARRHKNARTHHSSQHCARCLATSTAKVTATATGAIRDAPEALDVHEDRLERAEDRLGHHGVRALEEPDKVDDEHARGRAQPLVAHALDLLLRVERDGVPARVHVDEEEIVAVARGRRPRLLAQERESVGDERLAIRALLRVARLAALSDLRRARERAVEVRGRLHDGKARVRGLETQLGMVELGADDCFVIEQVEDARAAHDHDA
ncbi:hypothetical protein PybrP1_005960 [[Pythium] brassicae (nom. inval.)]|nr:hypothetical protein PybrP1_005960 [[Pythium] brassicae (nom. inval.)]